MKINLVLLIIIFLSIVSCRSIKQVTVKKEIPPITESKLLKNVEINSLEYNTLFAKRIEVSLTNSKGNNSFKASMKIRRDSFIQISVTAPLGIEVARVLLTKDSIKFVDVYHKQYFIADYSYFDEKFDTHINYHCIESILTNTFFSFEDCGDILNKNRKYKLDRLDSGYELSTVEEKALSRKIKKFYKKKRKNKDYILILQRILIDPYTFRPLSMSIEDIEEDTGVSVNYEMLKDFSGKIFPEKITFDLFSESNKTSLMLKIQKIEFNVPVESNFRILSKYKRIE